MKVLIIGAHGKIGRIVAKEMKASGGRIMVMSTGETPITNAIQAV